MVTDIYNKPEGISISLCKSFLSQYFSASFTRSIKISAEGYAFAFDDDCPAYNAVNSLLSCSWSITRIGIVRPACTGNSGILIPEFSTSVINVFFMPLAQRPESAFVQNCICISRMLNSRLIRGDGDTFCSSDKGRTDLYPGGPQ